MTQGNQTSLFVRITHGIGSVAYGVKENGFSYFLLLFYGTVVGVEPGLVGLAIFIALLLDAVSDPIVGYMSDNWRSKWGRRHPFMYASAIPVSLSYFLLWNPPDWNANLLFWYVLILAVLIRTFITFYETPSSSLMPELSSDYDERTKIQAYRLFFGWTGGNLMSVLMFGVLLTMTSGSKEGYAIYGVISSVLIFATIMISSLGTHAQIKRFRPPPPKREIGVVGVFKEIFETLMEGSFLALFVATLFGAVATGLSAALAFLMLSHFWGFSEQQIYVWTLFVFVSAAGGLILSPIISSILGKKWAVVVLGIIAFTMAPAPVIARLFGFMPENGDPLLYPLVLTINVIDLTLIISLQAILSSMIGDLVEQSEVKTGRRSEGVFFAAVTFTRKATQGLGGLAAGIVLSVINFPKSAAEGPPSEETLWNLGAWYAPSLVALWTCMIVAICFYHIDREGHAENLRRLSKNEA